MPTAANRSAAASRQPAPARIAVSLAVGVALAGLTMGPLHLAQAADPPPAPAPTPPPSSTPPPPPVPSAVLTVRTVQLRSNNGQVGCLVFNAAKGFPGDPSAAFQKRFCPIDKASSSCSFDPMPAGTYAVACFHDENNSGKMDKGAFGIPIEGWVVSNHAKGFMSAPSFDQAKFTFAGTPTEMVLRMGY